MLAKKFRLPVASFPKNAKTLHKSKNFVIKSAPNNFSYDRIGIVLTKKTAAKATERNRLRRKIFILARRSLIRTREGGRDLLIVIKPIKLDRDAEAQLLEELTLINERS